MKMRKVLTAVLFAAAGMLLAATVPVSAQTLKLDTEGPEYSGDYLMTWNAQSKIDLISYFNTANKDQGLDNSWEATGIPGAEGADGPIADPAALSSPDMFLMPEMNRLPASFADIASGLLNDSLKTVYHVGDVRTFTSTSYYGKEGQDTEFQAECVAVTESCTLWYNSYDGLTDCVSREKVISLADTLQSTAENMKKYFGSSESIDFDHDGKVAFVFYPLSSESVGGFFAASDLISPNDMDMLNINTHLSGELASESSIMAILVHEWQHLINCAETALIYSDSEGDAQDEQYAMRSDSWLNECFSQSSIGLNGYSDGIVLLGQNSGAARYMSKYQNSMTMPFSFRGEYVPQAGSLNLGVYADWYLFGRYLSAQTEGYPGGGDEIYKTILNTDKENINDPDTGVSAGSFGKCTRESLENALAEIGYLGSGENAKVKSLEELMRNYLLAQDFRQQSGVYSLGGYLNFNLKDYPQLAACTSKTSPQKLPGGYASTLLKIDDESVTVDSSTAGTDIRHVGIKIVYDGVTAKKTENGDDTITYALSTTDTGTKIYYTTDGSTPTAETGTLYDGTPVTLKADGILKAIDADQWGRSRVYTFRSHGVAGVRLGGDTRYDTMSMIVKSAFPDGSDTVVIASGADWPDALAASALAGTKGCPVLLTDKDHLSWQTAVIISRLNATKAILVGGTGALSDEIRTALISFGMADEDVTRIAGDTRTVTADRIESAVMQTSTSETCFICSGSNFADALSISAYSYANRTPVLLTQEDGTLSAESLEIAKSFRYIAIIGGTGAVSGDVETQLSGLTPVRLAGVDRYDTNGKIIDALYSEDIPTLAVSTGSDFPDALAGAALAGIEKGAILLTDSAQTSLTDSQKAILDKSDNVWVLGGEAAVSEPLMKDISNELK